MDNSMMYELRYACPLEVIDNLHSLGIACMLDIDANVYFVTEM